MAVLIALGGRPAARRRWVAYCSLLHTGAVALDRPPDVVLDAARTFGLDPSCVTALPGASRQTWQVTGHVLRVRPRQALRTELAVMDAAREVLPVPRVYATADLGDASAALLEMLPGEPAGDLDRLTPSEAERRGVQCGRLHERLARIRAPDLLPDAEPHPAGNGVAAAAGVVHLDLHPFNVLVAEGGRVTAVLDWANAARGHSDLDRARTLSILTLDPAARSRREDPRWVALTQGWIDAGQLTRVPDAARAWAYRYLLADLAHRYPRSQLAHVNAALAAIERPD
jgi:aminoglycoside phosphotransferase (APT) family kinase protein